MLQVGIIGYGSVARDHARAIRNSPDADLAAIIDPYLSDVKRGNVETSSPRFFNNLQEALAVVPLDAVIIASPTDLHVAHARAVVAAGLHALVEFPLYAPAQELDELASAARCGGRILVVAHTCRFIWSFARAKSLIDSGSLGLCKSFSCFRLMNRPTGYGPNGAARNWNDDALIHHAAHLLDLTRHWFGDSVALLRCVAPREASGHRNCALLLRGPNEIPISLAVTYDAACEIIHGGLTMENGTIEIGGFADLNVNGTPQNDRRPPSADAAISRAIAEQDTDFFAAILGRRPPAVPLQDSLILAEIIREAIRPV
ncbi:MAG: Gfo/Idh/MocA family oxidoreductase [Planctomycetota bacterium]|nr:Gfo/Idh/MocA family oxidoreductase [Planctomycetota bacterium]